MRYPERIGGLISPAWSGGWVMWMRPARWSPPVEPSAAEAVVIEAVRRAKLFVFLRAHRHELFDESFQAELAQIYLDSPKGQPPVPPAQLALAVILQAYTGVSDDEVIEATVMDRRWQLVLDCLDQPAAPFSKGTLVAFRARLITANLDRRLIERTIQIAQVSKGFGPRALRAALDSSPLWGAGRVEDTYNLMGHALRKALGVIACQQGRGLTDIAEQAGTPILAASSLKAALDLDWDDPTARERAVAIVLAALRDVAGFVATQPEDGPAMQALRVAGQVRDQDVDVSVTPPRLRQGVARDRRISIEDADMRHGRKSRSLLVDGYKRHILSDMDTDLVVAVGLTPANMPEAQVTEDIAADLAAQDARLIELHIDRAYLSSRMVRDRDEELQVFCKAWRVANTTGRYPKTAFRLDFAGGWLTCPNNVTVPLRMGKTVRFPARACAGCPLREQCTTSRAGRSVSIHPDEQLLVELRSRQQTPEGRAVLRQRTMVEHGLAHIGQWQGRRARYRSKRKNLFDLRRTAVVHNLHVIARHGLLDQQAAA
jgi:transposase